MQMPLLCLLERMVLQNKAIVKSPLAWEPVPGSDQIWLCKASLAELPVQNWSSQRRDFHTRAFS